MEKNASVIIESDEVSSPLQILEPTLLKEMIDVLTKRFKTQIQIKSVVFLSEPERRNLVLKISLESELNGVPDSLDIKEISASKIF